MLREKLARLEERLMMSAVEKAKSKRAKSE